MKLRAELTTSFSPQSGQLGLVAPGAYADIVAVPGDPLRDVKEFELSPLVMKDGKVFRDSFK